MQLCSNICFFNLYTLLHFYPVALLLLFVSLSQMLSNISSFFLESYAVFTFFGETLAYFIKIWVSSYCITTFILHSINWVVKLSTSEHPQNVVTSLILLVYFSLNINVCFTISLIPSSFFKIAYLFETLICQTCLTLVSLTSNFEFYTCVYILSWLHQHVVGWTQIPNNACSITHNVQQECNNLYCPTRHQAYL
jgi:hypothetical protein